MVNLFFFGILKVCLCHLKMLFENIFCEFILHKLKLWIFQVVNIPIIFAFIIVAFSSDWYRKLEDFALSEQLYKISSINDIRLWDIPRLWEKKKWASQGQSSVENTSSNRFMIYYCIQCYLYNFYSFNHIFSSMLRNLTSTFIYTNSH